MLLTHCVCVCVFYNTHKHSFTQRKTHFLYEDRRVCVVLHILGLFQVSEVSFKLEFHLMENKHSLCEHDEHRPTKTETKTKN